MRLLCFYLRGVSWGRISVICEQRLILGHSVGRDEGWGECRPAVSN